MSNWSDRDRVLMHNTLPPSAHIPQPLHDGEQRAPMHMVALSCFVAALGAIAWLYWRVTS